VPLIVLAGKEYGSGSSRDWAAKGTMLLGVKAVIAESFERIHRSNLVNMGVLPLQFPAGQGEVEAEVVGEGCQVRLAVVDPGGVGSQRAHGGDLGLGGEFGGPGRPCGLQQAPDLEGVPDARQRHRRHTPSPPDLVLDVPLFEELAERLADGSPAGVVHAGQHGLGVVRARTVVRLEDALPDLVVDTFGLRHAGHRRRLS
jgi:hypothetical protein